MVDKAEHRKATPGKPAGSGGGDVKDPEVRAAEQRNPDAATPAPSATTGGLPQGDPVPATATEAAGAANSEVAGDGKPAGDSERGESIVSESMAAHKEQNPATENPDWQNAQHGSEEKK